MLNSGSPNMWKIIRGLNGTPDANSPNKAMSQESQTITNIKSKTNILINHYTKVSKLNMSQANRELKPTI